MIRVAQQNTSFTWAVAGRNQAKLKEVVETAYKSLDKPVEDVPIIIADVGDVSSVDQMCSKARIVLNCVGPYRFYGEPVVKACIENQTHHLDISGEPQFLERIQLEYNQLAKDAGVYIIGSCGFDSIPCEMGLQYLKEKFPGDITYVEMYVQINHGPSGFRVNFGTWHSAIYGFAHWKELKPLRAKLFPEKLPRSKYSPPSRKTIFYSSDVDGWCLPLPSADKPVVVRSQQHLYKEERQRPYQLKAYLRVQSLFTALMTIFGALIFALFASFGFGRKLLEKYPKILSFGTFTKEGPSRKQIKESAFTTTLIGYGYEDKLDNPDQDHGGPPDRKLVVKVKGPEPGYVTTPICMVQAGMVILEERKKLPQNGGVYTPGVAFKDTTIIDRLTKNGMDFVSGNPIQMQK